MIEIAQRSISPLPADRPPCYKLRVNHATHQAPDIHSEAFLQRLMRGQLRLSIGCAAAFLIALLGLPLANYFFPELMAKRLFGFTLTWFILGVLFFPFVWLIAWIFIRRSIALEELEIQSATGASTSMGGASAPASRTASQRQ